MKFFKLDLLTLLISLFILNSCKNQDSIGLGVTSANQLGGSLIDSSTIIVNTVPEDSVVTGKSGNLPMGLFKDPVFGTTEANLAMDLNLPASSAYTLPAGTISIDSAVLVLRYGSGFYGDPLASRYKVNVYQLGERVLSSNTYYNTKQWKYNSGTLLGSRSFFARTRDTVLINAIVSGGKDSLQKVAPQLRIPIDKNFINTILFNASATQLSSNLVFKNNVNGLYVTLDKTGTTGAGGTFMMALDSGYTNNGTASTSSTIDVYIKTSNGSTVDTTMVQLPSVLHAAQIKHTYSQAIQTELSNAKTGSRNVIYLQGMAGLRAKVSFPYIKNILKTVGSNIVINRAELVITPTPGSAIPFQPLPEITMYQYDIANQRTYLQDGSTSDRRAQGYAVFGGFYSTSLLNYHFVITAYIQDLMLGKTIDGGTYIAPTDLNTAGTAAITPSAQTSARTFAVGTDKSSPYRIKLNIIYTKLAK